MKAVVYNRKEELSEGALELLGKIVGPQKPDLSLLYVGDESPALQARFQKEAAVLGKYQLTAQAVTIPGSPVKAVLQGTFREKADLLVLSSPGQSGSLMGLSDILLDETTEHIARESTTSLLIVKDPKPVTRILVCTDGSAQAEEAVRAAGLLFRGTSVSITLLNVIPSLYQRFRDYLDPAGSERKMIGDLEARRSDYLNRAAAILQEYDLPSDRKLREGNAAEEILKELGESPYHLVVMGWVGRKEARKKEIGRQSLRVAQSAAIPLLVVLPGLAATLSS